MSRILIHNATVLTMDPQLGDLSPAAILIEDGRIAAIEPSIEAEAERIDARGRIVIPGLVNAHLHTWQTALRGMAANWTLLEYFRRMHAGLATLFRPADLHIATLAGALNQINGGTTTLADWCHNNPSPAHNDAAIDGLIESGIRAVFLQGVPRPDPQPGQPGFWEIPHPRAELERLLRRRATSQVGIGAAILGPHYSNLDVALHDFRMAREFGVIASMHQGGGEPRTPEGWRVLEAEGLLGPHINIVHGNSLPADQLARFCACGVSFTVTPEVEMICGHGFPITARLRQLGRQPSLGVDIESAISGEMLTVARMALGIQRALDNADHRQTAGGIPDTSTVNVREALAWATIEGARALRMEDRIGSLRPGKQADLVLLASERVNMQPIHDPVAAVVLQASLDNIDSVMIAGRWKKRDGRLCAQDLGGTLNRLRESGERIVREMAKPASARLA